MYYGIFRSFNWFINSYFIEFEIHLQTPFCAKKVKGPGIELKEKNWQIEFYQKKKGKPASRRPFKMTLYKGKEYRWCTCGHSKTQVSID